MIRRRPSLARTPRTRATACHAPNHPVVIIQILPASERHTPARDHGDRGAYATPALHAPRRTALAWQTDERPAMVMVPSPGPHGRNNTASSSHADSRPATAITRLPAHAPGLVRPWTSSRPHPPRSWVDAVMWTICILVWMVVAWRWMGNGAPPHAALAWLAPAAAPHDVRSDAVTPATDPFAIYAPPSITLDQYRAFWRRTGHPFVKSADVAYHDLVSARIDPAIHAVIGWQDAANAGDPSFPPPQGVYNLHGLPSAAFADYPAAVRAWIAQTRRLLPPSATLPPTLDALAAIHCHPPQCNLDEAQRILRRTVTEVRQLAP